MWKDTTELIKNVAESVAIVCAGGWAIYTFWYQGSYLPSKLPLHLDVSTELSTIGHKNGFYAVKARWTLRNSGRRAVFLVASLYNVEAFTIDPSLKGPAVDDKYYQEVLRRSLPGPGSSGSPGMHTRYYSEQQTTVVANGVLLDEGYSFDLSEEAIRDALFYVPDRFDAVRVKADLPITADQGKYSVTWKVDNRPFLIAEQRCSTKACPIEYPLSSTAELSFWSVAAPSASQHSN